jgi:hypothetical protein
MAEVADDEILKLKRFEIVIGYFSKVEIYNFASDHQSIFGTDLYVVL